MIWEELAARTNVPLGCCGITRAFIISTDVPQGWIGAAAMNPIAVHEDHQNQWPGARNTEKSPTFELFAVIYTKSILLTIG